MAKINQEEYEILKGLDGNLKMLGRNSYGWLVATRENPLKGEDTWNHAESKKTFTRRQDSLFQFIQWEDEEPHNIAELIEEYERESHIKQVLGFYEEGFRNAREVFIKLDKAFSQESEETEVKTLQEVKNSIEDEIKRYEGYSYLHEGAKHRVIALTYALNLVNQLDEPEVLSQEWINRHTDKFVGNEEVRFVNTNDLQNLLVPKQELPVDKLETLSQAWIDENHFETENWDEDLFKSDGESIAHTPHIKVIAVQDLQNLLVPEQEEVDRAYKDGYEEGREHGFYKGYREGLANKGGEPETVADVVTTFWKSYERLKEVMNMEVEELEE